MKPRLLIVDDEEVIAFALGDYFVSNGCEVDTAMDMARAEALLAAFDYDLMIVDLRLGPSGVEGLDLVQKLHKKSESTRVILLTAYGNADVQRRAIANGVDCVMHKPVGLRDVERTVRSLLRRPPNAVSSTCTLHARPGGHVMSRKKILIVDDSQTVLLMEKMILSKGPYEVIVAKDGQEGYERALAERPDLILLDVVMPRLTGFEALQKLRAYGDTQATPVIMVTTRAEMQNVESAYENGCTDYVTKPINGAELMTKVKSYLGA